MRDDRRAYRLNVTAAGKKMLAQLTRCARRHERNLDAVIGMRDRKRFIQILKKSRRRLSKSSREIFLAQRPAQDAI